MKIIFDFDGVLTDQTEEAHRVREALGEQFAAATGLPLARVEEILRQAEAGVKAEPWGYGWQVNGRISAFGDEDLFVKASAISLWIEKNPNPLREALKGVSCADVGNRAYAVMLEETRAGKWKPLEDASKQVLEELPARGHEIVIVSNSETDRIDDILARAGVKRSPRLRVRGGAKKYMLGDRPQTFAVGPYAVDVDRPFFRVILEEELPQVAIGDVFSLDLALPAQLALTDSRFHGLRLFLRVRPYTPAWSREWCAKAGNADPKKLRVDAIETLDPLLREGGLK